MVEVYMGEIDEDLIYCGNCGKSLIKTMEIEYCEELNEFYCHPDCATNRYFDYMGSRPLEENRYDEHNIIVLEDGRLFKKGNI